MGLYVNADGRLKYRIAFNWFTALASAGIKFHGDIYFVDFYISFKSPLAKFKGLCVSTLQRTKSMWAI